jgi:hypothetical protein
MSLFSYPTGREAPIKKILDGTGAIELANGGDNGIAVIGLRIANVTTNTPTVTLDVYDGSTAYEIAHLRAFSSKETWSAVTLDGIPIILLPDEILRATASAANELHVTGAIVEPDQRT